jgi:hypothetical protein
MKRCRDRGQSGGQSFQNEHNPQILITTGGKGRRLNSRDEKRTSLISFAHPARSKFSRHFPVSLYVIVCIRSLTSGDGIAIAGSRNEFFVLRSIDVT